MARRWQKRDTLVDVSMIIPVRIALAQQNMQAAEAELVRISDPSSPYFGQHWSPAKVASHFAPSIQTVSAVVQWLNESNISPQRLSRSHDGGWIMFNATVAETQKLLKTEYFFYTSVSAGTTELATDKYILPDGIRSHVDFIIPTVHLGAGTASQPTQSPGRFGTKPVSAAKNIQSSADISFPLSSCYNYTTPDCLRAMYGIPHGNTVHPDNSLGIFEVSWESWLPNDLDMFFSVFNPALVGQRPIMVPIDGGYWQNDTQLIFFNDEADLDFEYSMALTYPLSVTNYQVGDIFQPGTLNNLLAGFDQFYCGALNTSIDPTYPDPLPGGYNRTTDCGTVPRPAKVLSVSYASDEVNFSEIYLQRQCFEFLKLGLQGTSVIVSSADCGPAGQSCGCIDPSSGTTSNNSDFGNFSPTSPAGCPFVTVVGGTQLPINGSVQDREVAFRYVDSTGRISTSGGGFSNVFAAPSWQSGATREYLKTQGVRLKNLAGRYNPYGRGIPDVAANAANYVVAVDGQLMTVMGTSASAPTFASLVANINDARLKVGKRTVGFMNLVLYANTNLMDDVTEGSNYGCGVEAFGAERGWDPVTGLGTPDYNKLLDVYMKLP
ncbi:hypothetical protein OIDMADRAFT_187653 [Oidiodendron maius Zn]|uniref:Peptidase S53 domain-containing protein n=1 Tax=Oidiodendron maius (strain Zn) TaxID=913774 RepID=A0A0C3HJB2_OIDMZ|nr:hypothetical protein OIDMADRAFT_187653 [Oidiodendron maius Zn]